MAKYTISMAILLSVCLPEGTRYPNGTWPSLTIVLHGPGEAWEKDGPGAAKEVAAVEGGLALLVGIGTEAFPRFFFWQALNETMVDVGNFMEFPDFFGT
jgi:hypothetical protein